MEVKNKVGRPVATNPKSQRVTMRMTVDEIKHLVTEANKEGKVLSEYIRSQVFKQR